MSLTLYIENGEISRQMGKGFSNPSNFPFYIGSCEKIDSEGGRAGILEKF
jgi:hypothetical protein